MPPVKLALTQSPPWIPSQNTQVCISLSARPSSFGTRFQNFLYRALGLDFLYQGFPTQDISGAIQGIRALGIRGAAISMPFKETCIPLLDELDPAAQAIGAINTIVNNAGRLIGYNTDYKAVFDLLSRIQIDREAPFALFGSGGLAKAVACALRNSGFRRGQIIARNERTGQAIASTYGYAWRKKLNPSRNQREPEFLLNCTPIGMKGSPEANEFPFPEFSLQQAACFLEGIANPPETPLVRYAKAQGKMIILGSEIVVLQAVEQFALYTGIRPSDELVTRAAAFAHSKT